MFCPQCNQLQTSENVKFCSRCGFELDLVSIILANGGHLPQLDNLSKSYEKLNKRRTILFGLSFWLVICFLFNLISIIFSKSSDGIAIAAGGFLLGLFIMILSAPFAKPRSLGSNTDTPLVNKNTSLLDKSNFQAATLPDAKISTQDFVAPLQSWKVNTTSELPQPLSITEETTNFLKDR